MVFFFKSIFKFKKITLLIIILICVIQINYWYKKTINKQINSNEVTIEIPPGAGSATIISLLKEKKLLYSSFLYKTEFFFRRSKYIPKAGEYLIPANSSISDIFDILNSGKVIQHRITFPECFSSYEIVKKINNEKNLQGLSIVNLPEEGSLLPETYFYFKGYSKEKLLLRMQLAMQNSLSKAWKNRQDDLPIDNKNDALILASMVESEAGSAAEKKLIASVFMNRIKNKMKFQSDPTVIYGFEKMNKTKIKKLIKKHLKIDHSWNTYTRNGLPKTPICNPGVDTIEATLNPYKTNYYYFVSDGMGGHLFSKTYSEHKNNISHVKNFLKKRIYN